MNYYLFYFSQFPRTDHINQSASAAASICFAPSLSLFGAIKFIFCGGLCGRDFDPPEVREVSHAVVRYCGFIIPFILHKLGRNARFDQWSISVAAHAVAYRQRAEHTLRRMLRQIPPVRVKEDVSFWGRQRRAFRYVYHSLPNRSTTAQTDRRALASELQEFGVIHCLYKGMERSSIIECYRVAAPPGGLPHYCIYRSDFHKEIILAIRGSTHHLLDSFTDNTGLFRQMLSGDTSRWSYKQITTIALKFLTLKWDLFMSLASQFPDYSLIICGHGIGAAVAQVRHLIC